MTAALVAELVAGIGAPSAAVRQDSAQAVTDVHRGLADGDVSRLAVALVSARLVEKDSGCQESQLDALSDLKAWHHIREELLRPLRQLREAGSPGPQDEYLDDLLVPESS